VIFSQLNLTHFPNLVGSFNTAYDVDRENTKIYIATTFEAD
jgi:hypothetical protein